jgi:HAD superfamily hydrolase (TIGR01509 family)
MIKALMFDFGNVIVSNVWHYDCPERDKAFETYYGVTMEQFEKGWKIAWSQIKIGKITEDKFWKIMLTESGAKNIDITHAKVLWRKYQYLIKDTLNLIIRLRNRYVVVGCTNNGNEWVEYYNGKYHLNAYFDTIVSSSHIGSAKPDVKIYQESISKAGVKPEEIIFIDDNDKVLEGAKNAGMKILKFINPQQLENDLIKFGVKTSDLDLTSRQHSFYWQSDRKITEMQIKRIFLNRHTFFDKENAIKAVENGMQQAGKTKQQAKVVDLTPPIKSGSINSVVKATIADGTKIIMRMHPNGLKNGYFWAEKVASEKAKEIDVPAYSTYFIEDTKKVVPFDFMLIEELKGENMRLSGPFDKSIDNQLMKETGKYMALIHKVEVKNFGFFDNEIAKEKNSLVGIHSKWKDHVFAAFEDNLNYLVKAKTITSTQQKNIHNIFEKNKQFIKCESSRLIQNDIADWNQLTDSKHVTGMIDWDECFGGDPVCDFSTWSVFFDLDRMQHLKKGYETVTKLPMDFEEKFHLYRLRYIISKMTLRVKRVVFDKGQHITSLLEYSKKILQDEFNWYGV